MKATPNTALGRLIVAGFLVLTFGLGGMAAWAALAPLHSAVVAPGVLVPETGRKTVKHPDGGIIAEILVAEGDRVRAGAPLLRLDSTEAEARVEMLANDYHTALATAARLEAELHDRDHVTWPAELTPVPDDPALAKLRDSQESLFEVRRQQFLEQEALLRERIVSLEAEGASLAAQRTFLAAELTVLREELATARQLFAKGNGPKTRVLELQKEEARVQARDRELAARIAQARQQALEAAAEITRRRDERREKALQGLEETRAELSNLRESLRDARRRLETREIVAPDHGIVVGLGHLAVGSVIAAGEAILDVVPAQQELLAEARVAPQDIEAVQVGMPVRLTLSAYDSRAIGMLDGTVEHVSADRLTDPATQQPYYLTRIRLAAATPHTVRGPGDEELRILPGMPVEAHILIAPRTPLDYLLSPLTRSYGKAFIQP